MHTYLLLLLFISQNVFATDYFVDGTKGNDSNNGSHNQPFKTIDEALDQADKPGDTINIFSGVYMEPVHTENDGSAKKPITIQAFKNDRVEIISGEKALKIDHENIIVKNIIFNGAWAKNPVCDINEGNVKIIGCEFKNTKRDIITIGSVENVLIESSKIHHGFSWHKKTKKEPHGISTAGIKNLVVRNCEIYQITGDCIQISPSRSDWDNILIEGCTFWVKPISKKEAAEAGLPAEAIGQILAENAIDLKADKEDNPSAHRIIIKNSSANGFRSTRIKNAAAFNIKNPVTCTLDGIKSWDNEIAMRLRFPAKIEVFNSLFYENKIAIRFEDDIKKLHILNNTFGAGTKKHLRKVGELPKDFKVINNLFSRKKLPKILNKKNANHNLAIHPKKLKNFFVDIKNNDYHLRKTSPAIDTGEFLSQLKNDLEKKTRPQNGKYDLGAFEFLPGE
jgi:Right handed beta helix region